MLIRSQDKIRLVNFDNYNGMVIAYDSSNDFAVCAILEVNAESISQVHLGNYSTEAKAIKVLDMIQAAYENCLYCDHAFDNAAQVQRPYIFASNIVFQMPQDSEVKV